MGWLLMAEPLVGGRQLSRWHGSSATFPKMKPAPGLVELNRELDALAEDGWWPECTAPDRHLWTSGDPDERACAAELCRESDCRVMAACSSAGEAMTSGVWGGIDRDAVPGPRAQGKRRQGSPADREAAVALRAEGLTYQQISERLGYTQATVSVWVREAEHADR